MALRIILIVLLVVTFPGMFLHYVAGNCGDHQNCPICQQGQAAPAEGVHLSADPPPDCGSYSSVVVPTALLLLFEGVADISPRAPPATHT